MLSFLRGRAGLILGAALFCLLVSLSNLLVLRIDVVGTGEYYRREVLSVLAEYGVGVGRTYEKADAAEITARILSLENVSFCSVKKTGSVLRVEVQTSSSAALAEQGALVSPVAGQVFSLTVVRGVARVQTGEKVEEGQVLVAADEAERLVMASARIACRYAAGVAASNESEALSSALLQIESVGNAEILEKNVLFSDDGSGRYLVEIEYLVTVRRNL